MPLTLSHPAAVLPLQRLGLPMTALVLGSMVLDVPLYLGSRRGYEITHNPLSIVTVDIALTFFALVVWFAVLRDPLVDLSPAPIRARLDPHARLSRRQWLLAIPAAAIAAATHIFWDSFTHADRWGYDRVTWLRTDHLGLSGLRWAQYGSALIGLAIVMSYAVAELRSLSASDPRAPRALGTYALLGAFGSAAVLGLTTVVAAIPDGLYAMAFHGVVIFLITLTVAVLAVCLAWHILLRLDRDESSRRA